MRPSQPSTWLESQMSSKPWTPVDVLTGEAAKSPLQNILFLDMDEVNDPRIVRRE